MYINHSSTCDLNSVPSTCRESDKNGQAVNTFLVIYFCPNTEYKAGTLTLPFMLQQYLSEKKLSAGRWGAREVSTGNSGNVFS